MSFNVQTYGNKRFVIIDIPIDKDWEHYEQRSHLKEMKQFYEKTLTKVGFDDIILIPVMY